MKIIHSTKQASHGDYVRARTPTPEGKLNELWVSLLQEKMIYLVLSCHRSSNEANHGIELCHSIGKQQKYVNVNEMS